MNKRTKRRLTAAAATATIVGSVLLLTSASSGARSTSPAHPADRQPSPPAGPATVSSSPITGDSARVREYWTDDAVRGAQPAPMPGQGDTR